MLVVQTVDRISTETGHCGPCTTDEPLVFPVC